MNATDEMNASDAPSEPPPSGQPTGSGVSRRLTRSSDDKVLTGLAGGLGRYVGVDPVVFRIAFVVLSFVGGSGILLYLAGWLLVPDETGASEADRLLRKPKNRRVALWVLGIIGIGLFLDGFDNDFGGFPFGVLLVIVGFSILWSRRDGGGGSGGGRGGEPPTSVSLAKVEPGSAVPPSPAEATTATKAVKAPKPRSILALVTLSVLAIAGGVLALVGVSPTTGFAVALLITGVAMVVGAWRGRARLLIPVALLLGMGLCVASLIDVPLRGGTGDRTHHPLVLTDVQSPYRLAIGEMTVDLGTVDLAGSSQTVVATVGVGHLVVIVPSQAEVVVVGHAGAGDLDLGGQHWDGTDVDRQVVLAGTEGGGRLTLRAGVGIGGVEVRRAAA